MAFIARCLVAAVIGLFAVVGQAQAATAIGKVVAVAGSPTSSGRPLRAGSAVFENDRLQTGRGNVQILFIDNTKLVVGPNSVLVLDRFLMRGGNRLQKFSVDALRGSFRFITGNGAKSAYDIQTANATIGIRGTAFDFSTGRETLLAVFEGGVRLCSGGRCESIPEGCGVGRARGNGVAELGGRAKGQALRSLPFIVNQGALSRQFRVNTRSCRASLSVLTEPGQQNSKGEGADDSSGPASEISGPPAGGGEEPGGPPGGGFGGGGPGGGGGGGPGGGGPP